MRDDDVDDLKEEKNIYIIILYADIERENKKIQMLTSTVVCKLKKPYKNIINIIITRLTRADRDASLSLSYYSF